MIEKPFPLVPPESGERGLDPQRQYHLVTPTGLAVTVGIESLPLRSGQHQPTVHRAAFSFFQARTDDGLPQAGETNVKVTLLADSPDALQGVLSALRNVARDAVWLVHDTEGAMRLIPPVGVDAEGAGVGGQTAEITLHLVAQDVRRYAADGSVMP